MHERTAWTRLRAGIGVLAVAAALAGSAHPASASGAPEATAGAYQPDLQISTNGVTFVGNGTYNTGGRGQAVSRSAARGRTASFTFRLQVDHAPDPDTVADDYDWSIRLTGCGSGNSSFKIRYYALVSNAPRIDVTSMFVGGGFIFPDLTFAGPALTPPNSVPFLAEVKVKQAAPVGATLTCRLQASTVEGADTVKFTVRRS